MDYYFYDTSSLLKRYGDLFDNPKEKIVISSITLQELEDIKNSNKDHSIKYAARKILLLLKEHTDKYEIHLFRYDMLEPITNKGFEINNDMKILATAIDYDKNKHPDEVVFVTNDMAQRAIANLYFGDGIILSVEEDQ